LLAILIRPCVHRAKSVRFGVDYYVSSIAEFSSSKVLNVCQGIVAKKDATPMGLKTCQVPLSKVESGYSTDSSKFPHLVNDFALVNILAPF
jgi:hypothetical protein